MMSASASAAIKLDLGGYFRGYGVYADNDEAVSMHEFDLRRNTEVHVSGETTLDNGLTVGFHTEQELGGNTVTDEAYAYFSGGWGRFNVGSEDGATYLLQVAAPSADSNVDGLRNYVQALNPAAAVFGAAGATILGLNQTGTLDYDQISDPTDAHNTERLSYMTPKFNGFQAGVSYAPTQGQQATGSAIFPLTSDLQTDDYENIWDVGARWDGEYQGFGISVGGGYSNAELEADPAAPAINAAPVLSDGLTQWNAGLNLAFSGFSVGGSYLRADTSNLDTLQINNAGATVNSDLDVEQETWVVGAAYDNGPWHVGASYLNQNIARDSSIVTAAGADDGEVGAIDAETDRFTIGGGYTFGPGMTFRGAVAWGSFDDAARLADTTNGAGTSNDGFGTANVAATSQDFSQVTVGTDIQF